MDMVLNNVLRIYALGIFVVAGCLLFWPKHNSSEQSGLKITAQELSSQYEENELAAEQKFKNKSIEVSGVLLLSGRNHNGVVCAAINSDGVITPENNAIVCSFGDEEASKLAQYSHGQDITICGNYYSFTHKHGEHLMMSNCVVIGEPKSSESKVPSNLGHTLQQHVLETTKYRARFDISEF